jgi:hypothetical protein
MKTQRPYTRRTSRRAHPGGAPPLAPLAAPRPPPPRVTVLAPRSGALVTVGVPVLICWATSCLAGLVLHHLQLSMDGGATYVRDIAPLLTGTDHHYLWIPPGDVVTDAARIRVRAVGWGEAVSEGLFRIQGAARPPLVPATLAPVCGACLERPCGL